MAMNLAGVFRALSDDTRLRILLLLSDGALCVGDLEAILRVSQPKLSRNLAYLRSVGLVQTRREGRHVRYEIARPDAQLRALLRVLPPTILFEAEARNDLLRLRALRARGQVRRASP